MSSHDTSGRIRVLAVDDHHVIRDGIAAIIAGESDMELVAEATNGHEAITSFRQHRPDVTLMDLRMPELGGVEAIERIRSDFPDARMIVLTSYAGDALVLSALEAGAYGYLLKNTLRRDLLEAIRAVHAGMRRIPRELVTRMAEHANDDALTVRELDVLTLMASGKSNRAIGAELNITVSTVKVHVKAILAKLAANSRTDGVIIAVKRGIIDLRED